MCDIEKVKCLEKQMATPFCFILRIGEVKLGVVLLDKGWVVRLRKVGLLEQEDIRFLGLE